MITKSMFVDAINNVRQQESRVDQFSKALSAICDGHPVFDVNNLYLKSLLEVLKATFNDQDNYISWWLWEDVEKKVWLPDDTEIDLSTPEQLYDFLIQNMSE